MGVLGDFLVYAVVRVFLGLVALLPLRMAYAVTGRVGRLASFLTARHLKIGLRNLAIAFPDQSSDWHLETFRRSFQRLGHLAAEVARLPRLSRARAASRVIYEAGRGLENYQQARRMGRGVLFVTAHISAWELLPSAHALLGHPLTFVVRPLDNVFLESWTNRVRSRFGNRTLPKNNVLRDVVKVLRQHQDIGFLLDQNVQEKEAVFAPFFGLPAATSPVVAALAIRTGAPVVAGFIYPQGRTGHYAIRFYPPIVATKQDTVPILTSQINALIEEVIREYPDCWLWGHRRFHTQPDGRSLYEVDEVLTS